MKLPFQQLSAHLQKGLQPIYFVVGEELLLVEEACTMIRMAAVKAGFIGRERLYAESGFDWENLFYHSNQTGLFDQQSVIEIRLRESKPGAAAIAALLRYGQTPPADKILLIIGDNIDNQALKTKQMQQIEKQSVLLQVWPLKVAELPMWTQKRLSKVNLQADSASVRLLVDRCEGNLLALAQTIDLLSLLHPGSKLTVEHVAEVIENHSRFNVFNLVDSILNGELPRVVKILKELKTANTEPLIILWALTRELRNLVTWSYQIQHGTTIEKICMENKIWEQRALLIKKALRRQTMLEWRNMLQQASYIDQLSKGLPLGSVWTELLDLVVKMAGAKM